MADDEEQLRELIASQKEHCPDVPPVCMETYGHLPERKVEHVVREGAIALIKGEDIGGDSFSQGLNLMSETWTAFWVLVLAMEDQELGSIYIDAPRNDKGDARYGRTIMALARHYAGIEEANDIKVIQKNIAPSHYIHRDQLEDIRAAILKVQKDKDAKVAKESKRKKAKIDKEEEEEEEEEAPPPALPSIRSILQSGVTCLRKEVLGDGQQQEHLVDANVAVANLNAGTNVINKVTFTIAIVKDVTQTKVVGYLIRFLVHDERWNPGKKVDELIRTAQKRELNKGNPRWRDPYARYFAWQNTQFPAFGLTWDRWIKCANICKGKQPTFEQLKNQLGRKDRPDVRDSYTNPLMMCSLRRALKRLSDAGGDVGTTDDYMQGETTAVWPEQLEVFQEESSRVFWDHPTKVGLFGQYFPRTHRIEDNPELQSYLETTLVPVKSTISELIPKFAAYKTGNALVHMAVQADEIENKARKRGNVREACASQMEQFAPLCLPAPGAIKHLTTSPACKAMNKWFYDFMKVNSTISRKTERYDPEMSVFLNLKASQMVHYEKVLTIVQAIIPLKLVILLSVYQRRKGLLGNFIIYGDHGGGKSFLTTGFGSMCFIPGTFTLLDRTTGAADQTDQDVHDEIRGYNEAPEEFISEKAAARKPDVTNLKKSAMTEGSITIKTMEYKDVPGHGKMRGSRKVTQAQNFTEIYCSNTHPDDGALLSRFHCHLMMQPKVPTNEMKFEVSSDDRRRVIDDFRVNQFMSCWIEKAMATFAIPCRTPFMGLFYDVSSRMIDALKEWGIIHSDKNVDRALKIMSHTARELTKERAVMQVYNIEGGIHYGKQFEPTQLADVAPYLWCDLETILLTWTLHSSDWIKDEFMTVLQAMCKVVLNKEYDLRKSPYQYYQHDVDGRIKFKTDKNYNHSPEVDGKSNRFVKDLNYFQIDGESHDAIFREIAAHIPGMPATDVGGTLKKMANKSFKPSVNGRNGYSKRMFADTLRHNHRATLAHKKSICRNGFQKEIDPMVAEMVETVYLPVCQRIEGLQPHAYRDKATLFQNTFVSGLFENKMEWMLIYLCPEVKLTLDTLKATIADLKANARLSYEDMYRVVNTFVDVRPEFSEDVYAEVPGLDFAYAKFILYALDKEWLMDKQNARTDYLKVPIIKEGVPFPHFATEEDIDTLGSSEDHTISVVDLSLKRRICFSPMAIELFDHQVIVDAFIYAALCKTTRPGKYLLGWPDERDVSRLQTLRITREFIDDKVRQFDMDTGPEAVSREEGIPFKRRGFREESVHTMLYGIKEAAKATHTVTKNIEVVHDLDRWAAEQQALICGLDRPIAIYDYERYTGETGDINYPEEQIQDKIRHSKENWTPNASTKNSRKIARLR